MKLIWIVVSIIFFRIACELDRCDWNLKIIMISIICGILWFSIMRISEKIR